MKIVCSFKVCFFKDLDKWLPNLFLVYPLHTRNTGGGWKRFKPVLPLPLPLSWGCPSCSFFYILFCSCVMSLLMVFTNTMQVSMFFCGYIMLRCVVHLFMATQFACLVFQRWKVCLKDHLSVGFFLNSAYRLKLKSQKWHKGIQICGPETAFRCVFFPAGSSCSTAASGLPAPPMLGSAATQRLLETAWICGSQCWPTVVPPRCYCSQHLPTPDFCPVPQLEQSVSGSSLGCLQDSSLVCGFLWATPRCAKSMRFS